MNPSRPTDEKHSDSNTKRILSSQFSRFSGSEKQDKRKKCNGATIGTSDEPATALEPRTTLEGRYEFIKQIGRGGQMVRLFHFTLTFGSTRRFSSNS